MSVTTSPAAAELAWRAKAAAGLAQALTCDLLLAGGHTLDTAAQTAHRDSARAGWPALIAEIAEIERLAPNAATAGWLDDAELMDLVERLRAAGHAAADDGGSRIEIVAAGFAGVVMEQLHLVARAGTRAEIRGHLEFAFCVWPKLCRRMSGLAA